MGKRYLSIWFRHLITDWYVIRRPQLRSIPFVICAPSHGRLIITAINPLAGQQGIYPGMALADARAICPGLSHFDQRPGLDLKLLGGIAEWCIRYTPIVAIDPPDGLMLDVSGCPHLWGGDRNYLDAITHRLTQLGYHIRTAITDTIGSAWAVSRFGIDSAIIPPGQHGQALLNLPAIALRIDEPMADLLNKLGLRKIGNFMGMPATALRRRFGSHLIQRLNQAMGEDEETIEPVHPAEPYQERLPCLEPIVTATGIAIALERLLQTICDRLMKQQKGLRLACFRCYRVDGQIETVEIGTNRPSCNPVHLFNLFSDKLPGIRPELGIELFVLDAPRVDDHLPHQEKIWEQAGGLQDLRLSELLDRLAGRIGLQSIHRFLPAAHHWPERSLRLAEGLMDMSSENWNTGRPRPVQLLRNPEPIEVTAPIPDYPPMMFRYKGQYHKIVKADGPERIEQEWWIQEGQHRDYYYLEDEQGHRYWVFRSGHYMAVRSHQWYMHGFFA